MTAPALASLRCHSCSHVVDVAVTTMRFVGLFKPSLVGRVPKSHPLEVRKRCGSCGFVNIFHPVTVRRAIELK